jgi:hypothetical protein
MVPVDQEIICDTKGDCFSACVASILECPLSEVPKFAADTETSEQFWKTIDAWLLGRGRKLLSITIPDPQMLERMYFENGDYCILTGVSPRRKADGNIKYHAVVGTGQGYGIKMVHDPHPDRTGLQDWGYRWVRFLVKI